MKRFMIRYRFANGTEADSARRDCALHRRAGQRPILAGRVSYRCMRIKGDPAYYHLATAADDDAARALNESPFFKRYTDATKRVAEGGRVDVTPMEIIGETEATGLAGLSGRIDFACGQTSFLRSARRPNDRFSTRPEVNPSKSSALTLVRRVIAQLYLRQRRSSAGRRTSAYA